MIKKADLPESAISADETPAPSSPRRVVISIVVVGLIAMPLFAGWQYVRKSTQMMDRVSSEIDNPESGLKAIARDSARSEARLSAIDAFLGAKFPEFGALFKIQEAQKAADDGDFSKAIDLLKKARALFSDAEDRKIDAPPDIFASAIEALSAMDTTTPQAAAAAGPVLNDLRVLLANYRSSLQQAPNLSAPFHGAPVRSASEISHLSITGGSPAVANPNPAGQLALLVSDVRIIKPAFQALDGIRWKDVTFIDTSIEYSGGPVDLINVRFVDCDFIVHPGANTTKFLEYAALDRHEEFSINATATRSPRS